MSYVLKSNRSSQNPGNFPLKVLGFLVMLLVIVYAIFPKMLPYIATTIVRPFWKLEQNARYGEASLADLQKTYEDIEAQSHKTNELLKENDSLKSMLGRTTVIHPLLATILKKPPYSAYDSLIIDVGASEHVQKGNRVYALGNIPIGEIQEVVGETSRVLLYTSSGQKFPIAIGTSSIAATATGKGGGYFEASLPRDTKIVPGDTVLIPALSNAFIGTVEALASEPSEPFSKILFRQNINIYEQRWVIVDTSSSSSLTPDENK